MLKPVIGNPLIHPGPTRSRKIQTKVNNRPINQIEVETMLKDGPLVDI
ncbi:hypothetical protein [Spirosoma pollinicola]|nr:hypothetical protein [Spirosoma pollinicola]